MAVTKIWNIKGSIGRLLTYAENPDKTSETVSVEYTKADIMDMTDVMDIAMLDNRAKEFHHWQRDEVGSAIDYAIKSSKTEEKRYVSGINCTPENARENMMLTKQAWQKTSGNMAYHGFQAFKPGEVMPDVAHKIGVKLAERLWGDRFEVVIATHIDRGHIHNHFVLNSVSFIDGRKYNDCNATYMKMRNESDMLCREYGLSVIENPERGKTKHYSEWNAERKGQPTQRSMVRTDVDTAICRSMTERQFFESLRKLGYEIKIGKDISVRYIGNERFVRLCRNFGDMYSIESIRRRILAQSKPEVIRPFHVLQKSYRFKGTFIKPHRKAGLRALYYYNLHRIGYFKRKYEKNETPSKSVYNRYRDDIRYLRRMSEEAKLLVKHSIDTDVQLNNHRLELQNQLNSLEYHRRLLRSKLRSIRDDDKQTAVKGEISELSKHMKPLRREISLCNDIAERSADIKDEIREEREDRRKHQPKRSTHKSQNSLAQNR